MAFAQANSNYADRMLQCFNVQDIQFSFLSFFLIRKMNIFLFKVKEKFEIEMPKG